MDSIFYGIHKSRLAFTVWESQRRVSTTKGLKKWRFYHILALIKYKQLMHHSRHLHRKKIYKHKLMIVIKIKYKYSSWRLKRANKDERITETERPVMK